MNSASGHDYLEEEIFKGIIGRTLTGIAISTDGETTLRLSFGTGKPHYVCTDGDCCSESWWADVLGAVSAYGGKVTEIRDLDLPEPKDDRSRQEVDSVYGYSITTTKGVVTLAFRNSSNGYYGGSAFDIPADEIVPRWSDDLNDWERVPLAELGWKEITTNDWRA